MDYNEKTNPVLDVFRRKEYVISVEARPAPEVGQQEIGQKLGRKYLAEVLDLRIPQELSRERDMWRQYCRFVRHSTFALLGR